MANNRQYHDDRFLTPQPGHQQYDDDLDDGGGGGGAGADEGAGKTEEFERFMATSIRAFDAMMDAVKGGGGDTMMTQQEQQMHQGQHMHMQGGPSSHHGRPSSRPPSRPMSRPSSRPASRSPPHHHGRSPPHHFRQAPSSSRPSSRPASPFGTTAQGLADSDSVAIVGNEYMVSEVWRMHKISTAHAAHALLHH
jgi:hypothetical protein